MELQPGSKRKAVGELLTRLVSRDPVDFNSAINSNFSPSVVYSGHGMKIKGASNLKHSIWLTSVLTTGQTASFELKDIAWSEKDNSATIRTVRYYRARFFPFFGFAVPVDTKLRFHADGGSPTQSDSQSELYVTSVDEYSPTDTFVRNLPLIGSFYQAFFIPVATFLILTLSNLLFAGYTYATSSKRQYIDTSVDALSVRAQKVLSSNELATNVNSGFQEGTKLAEGWGTTLVESIQRVSYPILSIVEHVSQQGVSFANRVSPLSLPYPFIYEAHSHPSGSAVKTFSSSDKKLPAPVSQPTVADSLPSQDNNNVGEKAAAVHVAPALDGSDQGKTVGIAERINNDNEESPAPVEKKSNSGGASLYDQLRKDGELPQQQTKDSEKLPVPVLDKEHNQASSEEDDHSGQGSGTNPTTTTTNGAPKKKKSGSKKKKAAVHAHPPSFKDGLHHAEEVEAQAHQHH